MAQAIADYCRLQSGRRWAHAVRVRGRGPAIPTPWIPRAMGFAASTKVGNEGALFQSNLQSDVVRGPLRSPYRPAHRCRVAGAAMDALTIIPAGGLASDHRLAAWGATKVGTGVCLMAAIGTYSTSSLTHSPRKRCFSIASGVELKDGADAGLEIGRNECWQTTRAEKRTVRRDLAKSRYCQMMRRQR